MKIKILFTGSEGNCSLLSYNDTNILIDAGFKTNKKMKEILDDILANTKIDGIVITHEHNDHFSPWTGRLCIENNIPLYVHQRHIEDEPKRKLKYLSNLDKRTNTESFVEYTVIKEDEPFCIKDILIEPFTAYHDAKKTLGFVFNKTFGYLADCGYISNNIKLKLSKVEHLALEFNYHDESIINSERHHSNKLRTFGRFGHLSCEEGIKFVKSLKKKTNLKTVITLHPSNSHCDLDRLKKELETETENKIGICISKREGNDLIILE
ncbi:MAG: MBL fold metallo-hydrolase [Fusobacteriaceae bacterium]